MTKTKTKKKTKKKTKEICLFDIKEKKTMIKTKKNKEGMEKGMLTASRFASLYSRGFFY